MLYEAETPRLWLECLALKHLQDAHLLFSSEKTLFWSSRKPTYSQEESQQLLQQFIVPEIDRYAIMLKPNNDIKFHGVSENEKPRMIGVVGTKVQIEGQEDMEMSYILHCDYWNKGYMTEALSAFAGPQGIFWRLENRKNIKRLVAIVDEENVPSMKTIAKIGGRRGERMIRFYGLGRDQDLDGNVPWEKMRDCISWYVDRRPGL